jgi:hypothetical protein
MPTADDLPELHQQLAAAWGSLLTCGVQPI